MRWPSRFNTRPPPPQGRLDPRFERLSLKERIRALLIDDDQGDFVFTKGLLDQITHPTIELDWVPTFEEGHEAMARGEYDIYLVDYFLEDNRTGLDLLREAQKHELDAPVIMLTGRGSHEVDVEAMQAGAADYLVKGQIQPDGLERCIRYALDRSEAQRALRVSEARHRGMFDNLPMGVYRCSPDGEFVDANPALVRILGYPDAVDLEKRYASTFYVAAEDEQAFKERLREVGVVRGFDTRVRSSDGRDVRIRNTARIHRDADGEVAYVEGVVEDVSRSEGALGVYQEAARYRALFECEEIAILALDASGDIQDVNAAFCALSGYGAEDLASAPLSTLFEQEDLSQLRTKDGSIRAVRTLSVPIDDGEGEPDRVLVVVEA
jgi:PAS domain S-box-containing protein